MRLEEKSPVWLRDIVQRFTKPAILVVDAYAGTFSVIKVSMLLPKHKRVIGCAVDRSCVTEAMLQWVLFYVQQLLIKESDIDREE